MILRTETEISVTVATEETIGKKWRLFTKSLVQRRTGKKIILLSHKRDPLIMAFLRTCERAATITSRHLINVPSKERFPIARNLLVLDRRLVQLQVPRPLFSLFYSFCYLTRVFSRPDKLRRSKRDMCFVFFDRSSIFDFVFRIVWKHCFSWKM